MTAFCQEAPFHMPIQHGSKKSAQGKNGPRGEGHEIGTSRLQGILEAPAQGLNHGTMNQIQPIGQITETQSIEIMACIDCWNQTGQQDEGQCDGQWQNQTCRYGDQQYEDRSEK